MHVCLQTVSVLQEYKWAWLIKAARVIDPYSGSYKIIDE